MLLFRLEENVEAWCRAKNMPRGALLSLDQIWALSQAWYGDRLSADYAGRTAVAAEAILTAVGLTGPFWSFSNQEEQDKQEKTHE